MNEFQYLNYHTEYSCEGTIKKPFRSEACFSTIFTCGKTQLDEKYRVRLYKGGAILGQSLNNACYVGKKEIIRHLKLIQPLLCPFTFNIEEGKTEKDQEYFDVVLEMNGDRMYHQYLLTWLRYLYEYPFNMIMKDAGRLRKEKEFKFESLANLFVVISSCYKSIFDRDIHLVSWGANNLLTQKQTADRIKELIKKGDRKLNHIYSNKQGTDKIKGEKRSLEFWESEEEFKKRINYYKSAYESITGKKVKKAPVKRAKKAEENK